MSWDRVESMARSIGLDAGLEARIADPLWMLARQWQVAEFRGDDAAQPVVVTVAGRSIELGGFAGISGDRRPLPTGTPLEAVVEAAPAPDFGAAGLHASARATRRLAWLLTDAGLGTAVDPLRTAFPLRRPAQAVAFGSAGEAALGLLVRHALDATALAKAPAAKLTNVLTKTLATTDVDRALTVIAAWRDWYARRDGRTGDVAWSDERLEHTFSVTANGQGSARPMALELVAPEHDGGHLDWYTFDLATSDAGVFGKAPIQRKTSLPTPIRYLGMPASRWWQFEDGTVNFGDLDAGPADLARLLVAEFATVFSNDWFVVPVKVGLGSVTEIRNVEVLDTFGERHDIQSTAATDAARTGGRRVFRLFELSGDDLTDQHAAPWLLVAPTLVGDANGPVLERVLFARDEGANLAWAVERAVEGPLGRAVDRAEAWHATQGGESAAAPTGALPVDVATGEARSYADQWWRYRLESPAPPWWIPFLPELVQPPSSEVRLRRARMHEWELLTSGPAAAQVGPQGVFLDPRRPRRLFEEEVQRSGVRMERRWQSGRWHDGSLHVWLQRRKRAGRGERGSGLRWDDLLPGEGPSPGSTTGS